MSEQHQLGGARQSTPLDDEMTYPLTQDEYLIIKDNLNIDKMSNLETLLLSTAVSSIVSWIVFLASGNFMEQETVNNQVQNSINIPQISILIIYATLGFGTLLAFFALGSKKNNSKSIIDRLDTKISTHLNKNVNA